MAESLIIIIDIKIMISLKVIIAFAGGKILNAMRNN